MPASDRLRREDNITMAVDIERGGDYSNESDDSSERARYAISFVKTLIRYSNAKKGGNNHFGSTGILKCLTCRKRKGKVVIFQILYVKILI